MRPAIWQTDICPDPSYTFLGNNFYTPTHNNDAPIAAFVTTVTFIKGVLDQDVPDTLLDRLPHLYAHGRLSQVYKPYSFWLNMVDAMYQSLVIFYVAYGAFAGSDVGIWEFGTVICTECLVVNSLHLAVNIRAWVSN